MGSLGDLSSEVLIALFDALANLLRRHKRTRNIALVCGVAGFIAALTLAIDPAAFTVPVSARPSFVITTIAIFLLMAPVITSFTELQFKDFTGNAIPQSVSQALNLELRGIAVERKVLEQRLVEDSSPDQRRSEAKDGDLFDANLELNLNQLKEYYIINKSQARSSFRMGVTAVVLGLIAILVGVGLLYADGTRNGRLGVAAVTGVAGLLSQFIGGSCFYLFNKAQDQSVHYYDRLTELQGTLLAVRLAGLITDSELADLTRQSLAFALTKWTPPENSRNRRSSSHVRKPAVKRQMKETQNGSNAEDSIETLSS